MNRIFKNPKHRKEYRYSGHGFVPKETNRPVQTADVLAWHSVQAYRRFLAGKPYRKDFEELLRDQQAQNKVVHGRKEMFTELAALSEFVSGLES
jgi:hypothetical protein